MISSIKSKIILAVILIVSAGFVAYEAYEFTEMKQAATAELHELADRTAVRLAESMVLPVWEIDKQWVASIIESEMQDKQLFAVIVYADGELFEGRERDNRWQSTPSANQFDRDYITASREIMRDGSAIGSVKVYITTRFMSEEIQTRLIDEAKVLLLVALLIVITLITLIDRVIVRALQQLLKQTQAIAEGDYSQSIQLHQRDEIGRLAASIDRMKGSIQQREKERNQAIDSVRESERRYRASVENAADAFFLICRDGCFKDVNYLACASLGYTRDALLTMKLPDIEIAFSLEKLAGLFKLMQSGEMKTLTGNHLRKDGSTFPVEVRVALTVLDDEQYILAYARDVSERKQAEDILRESELRFRSLFENAADGIFIADLDGHYIDVNSAGCQMLDMERDEIVGKTILDLIPPADTGRLIASKEKMLEGDSDTSEWILRRKDGKHVDVEVSATILPNGMWLGFVRNISERKQAEEKIRRYSEAMEQSGEAIMITDLQGTIEYINPSFSEMTGYSEQEALGQKPNLLKSGNQSEAYYKSMWDRLADGKVWHGKVVNRKKSGDFYPAMLTISPIKNEQGEITNYIALQQSLEELETLEAQFHQSQKMEAIGTLVGGIAHDFNNNLAGITGNLYLAKRAAKDMPEIGQRLETVEKLAFGAAATIQQLLTFSRKGIVEMHPLSISSFLKETVKLSEISLPENITFKLDVHDTEMKINGDIVQLQQVLMNLINNAHDAVEQSEKPAISISLHRFHADAQFIALHEGVNEGDYACIEVSDNGCGMSDENVTHIFEPFFTTKELGKGTGLGLAMVYGAVKTHGGVIDVESSQGEASGTTMRIYLPLIESDLVSDSDISMDQVVSGQGETILLVDDNLTVLETGRDVLEGLGYQVLTAEDGESAIEVYKSHMSEVDLIIFDVVMPKLGGVEALQAIRDFNPDVKAIFATGYDKLSTLGAINQEFKERVISKPFAMSKLSQLIREVLEER
nr:PAS domain S-box protein [Mariprofundus sp. KV]